MAKTGSNDEKAETVSLRHFWKRTGFPFLIPQIELPQGENRELFSILFSILRKSDYKKEVPASYLKLQINLIKIYLDFILCVKKV